MEYAIEIVSLNKEFTPSRGLYNFFLRPLKKEKPISAVKNVTIRILQGELFVLLGPNGAGKTTLLKILSCLVLPTSGSAMVLGYDILKEENKVKKVIGLISGDERSFYWRLTLRQNLSFFAALYNLSPPQSKKIIKEISCFLEIGDMLERRFQECSTGIKQRLAIARGLLGDPQVLFMDEPVKSLDAMLRKELHIFIKDKLIKERGKTVVLITHNLQEAEQLADRIAIMQRGQIRACGTLAELRAKINNPTGSLEEVYSGIIAG